MNCPLCKGRVQEGITSLTYELKHNHVLVVSDVPGRICGQCGETFIDFEIAKRVEHLVNSAEKDGVAFGLVKYNDAA